MSDFSMRINHALASLADSNSSSDSDASSSNDSQSVPNNAVSVHQAEEISARLNTLLATHDRLSNDSDTSDGSDDDGLLSSNPRIKALIGDHERNNDDILRVLSEVASSHRPTHSTPHVKSSDESNSDSQPSDGGNSRTEDEFVPDSPGVALLGDGEIPDNDDTTYDAGK
jgi:hypothetical protein